jgi:hypothetical protein
MKTYKELMEEIDQKKATGVGAKKNHQKIFNIQKSSTENKNSKVRETPFNVREKETDEHYETHHDTHRDKRFISRVHKNTGKITRNYYTHKELAQSGYHIQSYDVKNPNGEFK